MDLLHRLGQKIASVDERLPTIYHNEERPKHAICILIQSAELCKYVESCSTQAIREQLPKLTL